MPNFTEIVNAFVTKYLILFRANVKSKNKGYFYT